MKRWIVFVIFCTTTLFFGIGTPLKEISKAPVPDVQTIGKTASVAPDFGKIPLYFIANNGQVDIQARFYARTSRYTLWITPQGMIFDSIKKDKGRDVSRLTFLNSRQNPTIVPEKPSDYRVNFLKGNDRSGWHTQVPTSERVCYQNLYNNIDLKVYGVEKQIEYDWVIKPGGNPMDIRFDYQNIKKSFIDDTGNLVIKTAFGEWLHKKPVGYQVINGKSEAVEIVFTKRGKSPHIYGFKVSNYDKNYDLIIDPMVIAFTSYLGGNDYDYINGMVVDGNGSMIVAGYTDSSNFPVLNGWDETRSGSSDGFVTKFSPNGASLVFSTYVGGSNSDSANSIALDSGGIYIGGSTGSSDFPTLNAFQGTFQGEYDGDGFVCKMSSDGSGLIYSSFLGGSASDYVDEIAVNTSGELYALGFTGSTDFPLLNPIQSTRSGYNDLFVTKVSASGSSLVYSTLLGGSEYEQPRAIAIDNTGCAYITGSTASVDFPTANAFQSAFAGGEDGFVSKISSDGLSLAYSTYLGGTEFEMLCDIKVDNTGAAYVTGFSGSSTYPTTSGAYQSTLLGPDAAVITKLSPSGSSLVFSTFLGGSNGAGGNAIALDNGPVYIAGRTSSYDFPLVDPFRDYISYYIGNFIARLSPDGSTLEFSSFLSGAEDCNVEDMAVDGSGNLYLAGSTTDFFPAFQGFQNTYGGGSWDGFVTKLVPSQYSKITVTSPNGGEYWTIGSTREITWTAPAITENVKIILYYYQGYDLIENTIAESAPNTGSYEWTVPNISSDSCLIAIQDPSFQIQSDMSDANFTISGPPSITLGIPNGGEELTPGSQHPIAWMTGGIIGNVSIDYSIDGGNSWIPIAENVPYNDYFWTVPATPSTNCLVRVTDPVLSVTDTSDAVFTILSPSAITVTAPNGGESWTPYSTYVITWISPANVSNVSIDYSIDNGNSWTTIVSSETNTGSYSWTVPDTPSANCLVRVSQVDGPLTDTSDAVFTITPFVAPFIQLTSPNGGENWSIDITHDITWTDAGTISNVTLEYSTDNGNSWAIIASSIANTNSYNWTPPNTPSTNCLVRVSQVGGTLTDASDAVFTLGRWTPFEMQWSKTFGGASDDYIYSMQQTSDGGYILVGDTKSFGALASDVYLVKTDGYGNEQWNKTFGGSQSDRGYSVQQTNDGGYIITGYTLSFKVGYQDLYLIKTDEYGNMEWSKNFGEVSTSIGGYSVQQTSDGGYISVGIRTYSGSSVYTCMFLIKTDSYGNEIWRRCIGNTGYDYGRNVLQTSDGGYIIAAILTGWSKMGLIKVDSAGNEVWTQTYDGGVGGFDKILRKTPDGGYVIAGYKRDEFDINDAYLVKTDSLGNIVWSKTYGGAAPDVSNAVALTSDGGYIITGETDSGSGIWDGYLVKTDSLGNEEWYNSFGGTDMDRGYSVEETSDGGYTVAGNTKSFGAGVWDGYLLKFVDPSVSGINVVAPNGGENWEGGTSQDITWTYIGIINHVRIEYSTDNGGSWNTITASTDNNASYSWTVPNTSSTTCLVKVSDADGTTSDTSDAGFNIAEQRTITVTAPNGGESWEGNTSHAITWTSTGDISNVKLEYSTNSGSSWNTIAASTANSGSYNWTVPNSPSTNCLVKVSDIDGPAVDQSNAVFTILTERTITVTSPNGGESWEGNTSHAITWTSTGSIPNVMIEYSTNSGSSWDTIAASTANSGSYNWTVPNSPSTNCLVKVSDIDGPASDQSNAVFTILTERTVTVTAPNGGESWEGNNSHAITWTSTGDISNVKLEYSTNSGSSWNTIAASTANTGSYNWTVPNTPFTTCLVKISDAAGPASDQSNAVFTILTERTITVTSPNGGESWEGNTSHAITWTYTGNIPTVMIEYSTNNGSSWNTIAASTTNSGSYNWTVPNSPSTNCLVKVSDIDGPAVDQSNAVFTILTERTVTVTAPNGGESWEGNTSHAITWTSTGDISNVKLEYSTNSGSFWNTIAASTANTGSYNWTVPNSPSTTCLVKISDAAGPAVDQSNAVFTILTERTVTVTAPNGGESIEGNTSYAITWNSTGDISNVKLEYSTNSGSSWNTITASTANSGSYNWTVPNSPSTTCLVKVSDAAGPASDQSNAVFTILTERTITVTTPNGGESWEGNTSHAITWTSTGDINNVRLEYSTNSGSSWNTITASTANTGSYNWTVPNSPSTTCLVKVSDAAGPASDQSNAVFTILAERTITVTSPNGGESWEGNTVYSITWDSTGAISSVMIEYSSNSGSSWNTITASTANTGSYNWTVPNSPSSTCLIKISDITGPASDQSNALFNIVTQRTITVTSLNGAENLLSNTTYPITWTSTGAISSVVIEYSTNSGSSWNTVTASTANSGSYNWTIPAAASTSCLVKVSDTAGPAYDQSNAVFTISNVTYCSSSGTSQSRGYIARVQVGDLDNSSGSSTYTDFTSLIANLTAGSSTNITLTPSTTNNTEYWKIWIDYNRDGDFADSGENVYSGSGKTTKTGSFTVPTATTKGTGRMRVTMRYNSTPTYCDAFSYGEVEDYTVNIQ